MRYADRIKSLLTPVENRIFQKQNSPAKIQDYLDTLPINFEHTGETYLSPRRVIQQKTAHCFEGALLAAAVLAYHDRKPLLLDLRTVPDDEDHVVTLFEENGYWGAISKTNHVVLRYRDPVFKTIRELVLSYFNEYALNDGSKNLRAYSNPIDLSKYAPEKWVTTEKDLFWLVEKTDSCRHSPIAPKTNLRRLRPTDRIERKILDLTEWKKSGKRNRF